MDTAVQTESGRRAWPVRRAAFVGGAAVVLFLALGLLAPRFVEDGGPLRFGILVGTVCGALGGAVGLVLVSRAAGGKFNELLLAQMLGFVARVFLVGVGLVIVQRLHGDTMGFVGSFFVLFFLTAGLEALLVRPPDRSTAP